MKKITDEQLTAMKSMGGEEYARQEAWDIQQAASAVSLIANLAINEVDEPDDVQSLANILRSLMEFINGEITEMVTAARQGEAYEKSAPRVEIITSPLKLDYVKSLHLATLPDLAVKYVSKDTIRHPVFLWGAPNLTDLEAEYFTRPGSEKGTDLWDEVLGKSPRPLTWDHATDPSFKADPLIGSTVDWEDDEIGRWAISVLKKGHTYRDAIDKLIKAKSLGSAAIGVPVLGASSDSAPQYVKRVQVGKSTWLARWPWFATALTPSPCEPRMIGTSAGVDFVKSLGITLPDTTPQSWDVDLASLEIDFLKAKSKLLGD